MFLLNSILKKSVHVLSKFLMICNVNQNISNEYVNKRGWTVGVNNIRLVPPSKAEI